MSLPNRYPYVLVAFLLALLSACGGGGGSSNQPAPPTTAEPAPTQPPPIDPPVEPSPTEPEPPPTITVTRLISQGVNSPVDQFLADITTDPHNAERLYARVKTSNMLYRSEESGQGWLPILSRVAQIELDQMQPELMYAVRASAGLQHVALYRSFNAGNRWEFIDLNACGELRDIRPIFASNNLLYIYDDSAGFPEGSHPVICKTQDAGETWQRLEATTLPRRVDRSAILDGQDPPYVIAASASDPDTIYAGFRDQMYRSTNGGENFVPIAQPVIASPVTMPGDNTIIREIILQNGALYVKTTGRIFRSTDGGASLNQFFSITDTVFSPPSGFLSFETFQIEPNRFTIDALNTAEAQAQNRVQPQRYQSLDDGLTWQLEGNLVDLEPEYRNLPGELARTVTATSESPATLYTTVVASNRPSPLLKARRGIGPFETDETVLLRHTENSGQEWQDITPSVTRNGGPHQLKIAPSEPSRLYYDAYGSLSLDRGESWQPLRESDTQQGLIRVLAVAPNNPQVIYSSRGCELLQSVDAGNTWQAINTNISNSQCDTILQLAIDPRQADRLYAVTQQFFVRDDPRNDDTIEVSNDGGITWQQVLNNSQINGTKTLYVDQQDANVLYLIAQTFDSETNTFQQQLHQSLNAGSSWSALPDLQEDDEFIVDLVANGELLYLVTRQDDVAISSPRGIDGRLLQSVDSGNNWEELEFRETEFVETESVVGVVYDLELISQEDGATLYLAADGGVFELLSVTMSQ